MISNHHFILIEPPFAYESCFDATYEIIRNEITKFCNQIRVDDVKPKYINNITLYEVSVPLEFMYERQYEFYGSSSEVLNFNPRSISPFVLLKYKQNAISQVLSHISQLILNSKDKKSYNYYYIVQGIDLLTMEDLKVVKNLSSDSVIEILSINNGMFYFDNCLNYDSNTFEILPIIKRYETRITELQFRSYDFIFTGKYDKAKYFISHCKKLFTDKSKIVEICIPVALSSEALELCELSKSVKNVDFSFPVCDNRRSFPEFVANFILESRCVLDYRKVSDKNNKKYYIPMESFILFSEMNDTPSFILDNGTTSSGFISKFKRENKTYSKAKKEILNYYKNTFTCNPKLVMAHSGKILFSFKNPKSYSEPIEICFNGNKSLSDVRELFE